MVSKASDDFPEPESPVKTTSLSLGMDRVTFLRLCSRAPRIVIWSVGIGTPVHSFSLVTANVPLAAATSRRPGASIRPSATMVRRPAWTTRPVASSFSPTLAGVMKLSFKSKLMARATPGVTVRRDRPMAESARALIMPPWTKPAWLAMSGVGVISSIASPSPSSASVIPSQAHAADTGRASLLTALPLRHRHAGRRRPCHQAVLVVQHVRLAEQQRLAQVDDPAHGPQPAFDHRPQEVDLQLDRRVPHPVWLERGQRHPHSGVGDLSDHPALDDAAPVPVLRPGDQLEDDTARLGLRDPRAERLHPAGRLGAEQRPGPLHILNTFVFP